MNSNFSSYSLNLIGIVLITFPILSIASLNSLFVTYDVLLTVTSHTARSCNDGYTIRDFAERVKIWVNTWVSRWIRVVARRTIHKRRELSRMVSDRSVLRIQDVCDQERMIHIRLMTDTSSRTSVAQSKRYSAWCTDLSDRTDPHRRLRSIQQRWSTNLFSHIYSARRLFTVFSYVRKRLTHLLCRRISSFGVSRQHHDDYSNILTHTLNFDFTRFLSYTCFTQLTLPPTL